MLEETPLRESHDVGILLQHKIERLEEVPCGMVPCGMVSYGIAVL